LRQVTIRDVADAAGVSKATASRVLSGHPATSPEARDAVQAAARRLGFRPNAQARSLRSTRTRTLGLLLPDVRNPFFADLAHAVEQKARTHGYLTLFGNTNESIEQQDQYIDLMLTQRVDGVIAAPQGDKADLGNLLGSGVPLVFVDRVLDGVEVPSVRPDNSTGIHEAVRYLTARGHRRIGYIGGPQFTSTGRERLHAYREALAAAGADDDAALIYDGDFQTASGTRGAHALLDLENPPTAVLAADGPMSIGAVGVFNERGILPGTDLAFIAHDDLEAFALLKPALTVIAHDIAAMGRLAVDLLIDVIGGGSPASSTIPGRLVVRGSTP
jgi:LacI family transcriptional regulator